MYAPWHEVFPDHRDVESPTHQERELTPSSESSPGSSPAVAATTVVELTAPDGSTVLEIRPPQIGAGLWVLGIVFGAALLGMAAVIAIAPASGGHSVGSMVTAAAAAVLGIGFALLMLHQERGWCLDRDGVHRITGLGRRTTPWTDIARIRLVVTRAVTKDVYRTMNRLYFLDSCGRSLVYLHHFTGRSVRGHSASDQHHDLQVLRFVAGECDRHGWLSGVEEHRRRGKEENITALMEAVDDIDELDRLLRNGADLSAQDSEGLTALHYAAAWGGPDAVQHLLAAGAEIDVRTPYGFTPLRLAESRHLPTVDALRAAGATSDLPPLTPVTFSSSHWWPVVATLVPALVVLVGISVGGSVLLAGSLATASPVVGVLIAVLITALLVRASRPWLFWSGGVPTGQDGSSLTLRTPWGARRRVDLDRVTAAMRTPPSGHRPGRIHGSGVLLVVDSVGGGGNGTRLTVGRLAALRLGRRNVATLGDARLTGHVVVLDPRAESAVLAAVVPWLVAGGATVDPELLPPVSGSGSGPGCK